VNAVRSVARDWFGQINPTEEKLRRFSRLREGWSFGVGAAIDESTIDVAVTLLRVGLSTGVFESDVFPGLEGEIRITFYYGAASCDVTVESDLKVTVTAVDANGIDIFDLSDLTPEHAAVVVSTAISQILYGQRTWITLASSTPSITMYVDVASMTWASSQQNQITQFRYLKSDAQSMLQGVYVTTLPPLPNTVVSLKMIGDLSTGASPLKTYSLGAPPHGTIPIQNRANG
jgi:hypothetical protein